MSYNNCPALSAMLLTKTVPTEFVIVIVPLVDLPTRSLQFGAERSMYAPPSMKSPVINSVGPDLMIGSPGGGPIFEEPRQRGLTNTVILFATLPGRTLCVRIV